MSNARYKKLWLNCILVHSSDASSNSRITFLNTLKRLEKLDIDITPNVTLRKGLIVASKASSISMAEFLFVSIG